MHLVLGVVVCLAAVADSAAHGDIQVRLDMANKAVEMQPEASIHYLERADLHREHRDWEAAEADIARARDIDPADPDIAYFEALLQRDRGELERAARSIRIFLERSETGSRGRVSRTKAHEDLALVLGMLGEWRGAEEQFNLAIAHSDRPSPQLYLDRAEASMRAGGPERLQDALRGLDEGIARLGMQGVLQNRAIEFELDSGNYDGALSRIERRMAAPGYRLPELVRKAEVLERAGRRPAAVDAYLQARDAIRALPAKVQSTFAVKALSSRIDLGLSRVRGGEVPLGSTALDVIGNVERTLTSCPRRTQGLARTAGTCNTGSGNHA